MIYGYWYCTPLKQIIAKSYEGEIFIVLVSDKTFYFSHFLLRSKQ